MTRRSYPKSDFVCFFYLRRERSKTKYRLHYFKIILYGNAVDFNASSFLAQFNVIVVVVIGCHGGLRRPCRVTRMSVTPLIGVCRCGPKETRGRGTVACHRVTRRPVPSGCDTPSPGRAHVDGDTPQMSPSSTMTPTYCTNVFVIIYI